MFKFTQRQILGGLGAIALLGASATFAVSNPSALALDDSEEAKVRVGTFQPQLAFQSYNGASQLAERIQGMQQEAMQAQEQGDQQRAMELQARMQQMQSEVVEQFYADLEKAMPDVAEEAGVKIIAVDVIYTDPAYGEPKDLTTDVVRHLNHGEDQEQQAPAPPSPW